MTEQQIRDAFFRTRDAFAMLRERTARVDSIVAKRWEWMPRECAVAAVGGYGRRELFPCSDIDLLILTPDEKTQSAIKEPLAMCLRDLWDKSLRISQSVHTPADCNLIDNGNAELAVSLIDRRFLAGHEGLFQQIRAPRPELGRNIVELTRKRHAQYHNTIYHLEPNVKDTPGGLRDLQVLRWLAKLSGAAAEPPEGVAFLFEIRCYLHYLAGRDDNKLTFERQDEVAKLNGSDSPESMMRRYYRAVRYIERRARRQLDRYDAGGPSLFAQLRDRSAKLSNNEFSVLRNAVFLRGPESLESDPDVLLRLFEFAGRTGVSLAPDSEERIERHAASCGARFANLWPRFRAILLLPFAAKALRAMHETGVLEVLFPELRSMEALVIRDFNHRYTVDEHTLVAIETVLELRAGASGENRNFCELASETEDFDLLLTALLFHDVGKGSPDTGHVGASILVAEASLKEAGIDERSWGTVEFLIGAHLEMSATMSGRDLSDPATARYMAGKAGTVERLKLLTLLTFGDTTAVHPGAMTPWRRQLLWNLYTETYAELTRELTVRNPPPDHSAIPGLAAFLEGLPPRYHRTHTQPEIEEHLRLATGGAPDGIGVSLVRTSAWVLTVVARDRPFLFASIAAAISSFGFNILKAEAFSNARRQVIDTVTFADPLRSLELNPGETEHVIRTVGQAIRGEIAVEKLLSRRPAVKPDHHALAAASATFDNQASPVATLLQLVTQDRPGLLYDVASLISSRGVNIEVVLVDTEARKAIDVFYVTKGGARLGDDDARSLTEAVTAIARAGAG